jgi:hypothetical protein
MPANPGPNTAAPPAIEPSCFAIARRENFLFIIGPPNYSNGVSNNYSSESAWIIAIDLALRLVEASASSATKRQK